MHARRPIYSQSGFTLVEILIVIAIISTVLAVSIPAIERVTFQRISSTARRFVGLIRTVRNDAVLLNNIYRIGFDMDKNTYWVQSQRQLKTISQKLESEEQAKAEASNFNFADKYSKQALEMPGGTKVLGVFKEGEGLSQKGAAVIHFFPNGFNEAAIIYLAKEGSDQAAYSLLIHPTGRAEVQSGLTQSLDEKQP
jgi:prepilin-type N-terminal cleavage/methylation domain-containing protein